MLYASLSGLNLNNHLFLIWYSETMKSTDFRRLKCPDLYISNACQNITECCFLQASARAARAINNPLTDLYNCTEVLCISVAKETYAHRWQKMMCWYNVMLVSHWTVWGILLHLHLACPHLIWRILLQIQLIHWPCSHLIIHWSRLGALGGGVWLSTALLPPCHMATVGEECSQQGSSSKGHQEDGDGDTHNSTSTENTTSRCWVWVYRVCRDESTAV